MRYVFIVAVSVAILLIGYSEASKVRSVSKALEEIIKFINFYDTQLNYRKPDYEELCAQGEGMGLQFISFDNKSIALSDAVNEEIGSVFREFINQIGTTDTYGQTSLCKEYLERFSRMLSERKACENNKIKVNIAVSILGAVGVFITFV